MAVTIIVCNEALEPNFTTQAADDAMLDTAGGRKRADSITEGSHAARQLDGADENGHVVYTANYGGVACNRLHVAHSAGGVGAGYQNRPLAVAVAGFNVAVTFGTGASGESLVPTAQEVAAAVNAHEGAAALLTAAASGDGSGRVGTATMTSLYGGTNGDLLKFAGRVAICRPVSLVTAS